MNKEQVAELMFKFIRSGKSEWSYEAYLDASIRLSNSNCRCCEQGERDDLLRRCIKEFIEENKPAPQHFYLRLKETGEIIGYETSPNSGNYCCDVQYHLTTDGEASWEAESVEHAIWVKYSPTEWYNAGYETPNHCFKPEELEVVDEYGTVYENKPMSDMQYAIAYCRVYGDDDYLRQLKRRVEKEPDYNPEETYSNNWYSVKHLMQVEKKEK